MIDGLYQLLPKFLLSFPNYFTPIFPIDPTYILMYYRDMKNLTEKWIQYKDTNYFVSNYGEVKRKKKNGRWSFLSTNSLDRYGYPKVIIPVNGKNKCVNIHRLVAELFIPNPENKPQVNHINGDKTNNRVSNLEWVTSKENMDHCFTKLHTKVTVPVIRISPDYKEFVLFPSCNRAASVTGGVCGKEIAIAAKSFLGDSEPVKRGGYYWHYIDEFSQE